MQNKTLPAPIDATEIPHFAVALASYGIAGSPLEAKLDFYSGSDKFEQVVPIAANKWQMARIDLSTWPARNAIDRIDITFRSATVDSLWAGKHFIDALGFLTDAHQNHGAVKKDEEQLQAAALALAYYKSFFTDGIDALFYHRQVDNLGESSLRFGLWSSDPSKAKLEMPLKRRPSWDVYRKIDTAQSLQATEFAKSIIGIKDWTDLIPNFDPAKLAIRALPQTVDVFPTLGHPEGIALGSFENETTNGWTAAENATSVSVSTDAHSGGGALDVQLNPSGKLWKGAELELNQPLDAHSSPYLNLALKLTGVNHTEACYMAKIKLYSSDIAQNGKYTWVEGDLPTGSANGDWRQIALDLRDWNGIVEQALIV